MMQSAATRICILILALPLIVGCARSDSGDSHVQAGLLLYNQRKFAEAIPELKKSLDKPLRATSKSDVLTTIGNCYNELDQFDDSLEYHEQAIQEDPENYHAYVNKGVVHRLLGEYDEAAELYSKALALEPDYAELHASLGALAMYQDNCATAIEHLERAVELDDTLPVAHSNLAIAYATDGRFDDADKELKKAITRGYHQPERIRERIELLRSASDNTE